MIGKLRGVIEIVSDNQAIIDVGGVGYLVASTAFTMAKLMKRKEVELMIETQVKDDAIKLFGFLEQEERKCFVALLKINGISHTLALNILSFFAPEQISLAVQQKNSVILISAPGIGSKMAARIINELVYVNHDESTNIVGCNIGDAITALINLGYKHAQASNAVEAIKDVENMELDEIIYRALQDLS